jgi:hypothetical protein
VEEKIDFSHPIPNLPKFLFFRTPRLGAQYGEPETTSTYRPSFGVAFSFMGS